MRVALRIIGLCAVCCELAFASDYEVRLIRVAMPVPADVRAAIDKHLGQPLDTVLLPPDKVHEGLDILGISPTPNDWDGTDLLGFSGVEGGGNPIPMSNRQSLFTGRETPVEYLEPRKDGRFDRKIGYEQHGLTIALSRNGKDVVRVWTNLTQPGPRQPLEGVSLDVGPPTERKDPVYTNFVLRTSVGQWVAALFTMRESKDSQPELLLFFLRDLRGSSESEGEVPAAPIQFSIETKFLRIPSDRVSEFEFVTDDSVAPIAGRGQRVVSIRLPSTDTPCPVDGSSDTFFEKLQAEKDVELLSAPRVTTMAGLTDRDDTSQKLFKVVVPNDPKRTSAERGGFGGGAVGGAPPPFTNVTDLFSDRSTLIGKFMASGRPGKPAVIADILTQKLKVATTENGEVGDVQQIYTGIMAGVRIACTSAAENIVLDVALIERYLDWPPPIKLTRKGSPARPNPIETTVPDESTPPRLIERGGWFRQPVEDGETLAYLLQDDVRADRTLVFVTIKHVERDTFVPVR